MRQSITQIAWLTYLHAKTQREESEHLVLVEMDCMFFFSLRSSSIQSDNGIVIDECSQEND